MDSILRQIELTGFTAVLVVLLGFYSHLRSAWTLVENDTEELINPREELCSYLDQYGREGDWDCGVSSMMEYLFLVVISTSLSVCLLTCAIPFLYDEGRSSSSLSSPWQLMAIGSHASSSILMMGGATLYIISAWRMHHLNETSDFRYPSNWLGADEKYIAGAAAYLQAVGHYTIAIRIFLIRRKTLKEGWMYTTV